MSYSDDELELRRIHEEAERKKRELEALQMEELRRIREMERGGSSSKEYDPLQDSAFNEPQRNIQTPDFQPRRNASPEGYGSQNYAYEGYDYQDDDGYEPEHESYERESYERDSYGRERQEYMRDEEPSGRRAGSARRDEERAEERARRQRQEERQERPRKERKAQRTRTYDPDQAVSDEEFINSYEAEYDDDDYEENMSYEEAERRDIAREKRAKDRHKEEKRENKRIQNELKKQKKQKKKKHRLLKTLIALLLILILTFAAAIWNITRRFDHIDTEVSKRVSSMKGGVVNVLLIGQDARDGQSGQRSDSMILISINTVKNSVAMTSIMRDTYVQIPGQGGNRINAAYAFGGIDLLDKTIEENFGVTIDGNAMVDFDGFLEAMTAVGNLEMDLTADEAAYMNANPGFGSNNDASDEVWNLTAGRNTLTPSQLLAYSRIRHVGNSDWDRTERQRKVISGAVSKVKHGHFISGYNLATKAAPSITTDIKTWGMLRVAFGIMTGGEMKSHIIPVEGTYYGDSINGMSVLVPDIEKNKEYLQRYINGEE